MNPKESAVDEFFNSLPTEDTKQANVFDDKPAPVKDAEPASVDDEPKNRRERRLLKRVDEAEKARIAAESRAQTLSELHLAPEKIGEIDSRLTQLYGDTPQGKLAAKLHQDLINEAIREAKNQTTKEIETKAAEAVKQQREFESFIDTELETLEEHHNIDLTSNAPAARKARREFLEMVESLSPKDQAGTVTGYADFNATWELYQLKSQQQKTPSTVERQKELASRSMTKSSGTPATPKARTPGFDGWKYDLGLN